MGTKFDYFGELAYPIKENEMLKTGFTSIKYGWWHFNAVSRENGQNKYQIVL